MRRSAVVDGLVTAGPAYCRLPTGLLRLERQAAGKDAREAQDRRQTHDLLEGLQLVAGNDDLITRNEICVVGSLTFVDGRNVHGDW